MTYDDLAISRIIQSLRVSLVSESSPVGCSTKLQHTRPGLFLPQPVPCLKKLCYIPQHNNQKHLLYWYIIGPTKLWNPIWFVSWNSIVRRIDGHPKEVRIKNQNGYLAILQVAFERGAPEHVVSENSFNLGQNEYDMNNINGDAFLLQYHVITAPQGGCPRKFDSVSRRNFESRHRKEGRTPLYFAEHCWKSYFPTDRKHGISLLKKRQKLVDLVLRAATILSPDNGNCCCLH
jgi:hypothetical protein